MDLDMAGVVLWFILWVLIFSSGETLARNYKTAKTFEGERSK